MLNKIKNQAQKAVDFAVANKPAFLTKEVVIFGGMILATVVVSIVIDKTILAEMNEDLLNEEAGAIGPGEILADVVVPA